MTRSFLFSKRLCKGRAITFLFIHPILPPVAFCTVPPLVSGILLQNSVDFSACSISFLRFVGITSKMAVFSQVMLFVSFCLLNSFIDVSLGFGTGAPPGACVHMTPGHLNRSYTPPEPLVPQEIDSPYTVTVSPNEFGQGDEITVTIGGTENFVGFFIQARVDGEEEPVGSFSDIIEDNMKYVDCSDTYTNDAVTHTNQYPVQTPFESIALKWTSPNSEIGNIKFYATVAQNHDIYWVKLESESLTYNGFTVLSPTLSLLLLPVAAIFTRYL